MCGQDAGDETVAHASNQPHAWRATFVSGQDVQEEEAAHEDRNDEQNGHGHPDNEVALDEEVQELVQSMRWLGHCGEERDEYSPGSDEDGPESCPPRKGLMEKQARKDSVEHETGCLEGAEEW